VDKPAYPNTRLESGRLVLFRETQDIDSLRTIFKAIHEGKIHIGGKDASLELITEEWKSSFKQRSQAQDELQTDYPCFLVSAHGAYPSEMETIERRLRETLPLSDANPYMNLAHACRLFLSVKHGTIALGLSVELVAPIHAYLQHVKFEERYITIELYSKVDIKNLKTRVFGVNQDGTPNSYRVAINDFTRKNTSYFSTKLPSDQKSSAVVAMLYFKERLIEQVQAEQTIGEDSYWTKMLIERVDPNLEVLESWIEGAEPSMQSEKFERGVAILLFLCNLRSLHVGGAYEDKTKKARRSNYRKTSVNIDVFALTLNDDSIFVCQCTTDWNPDKVISILDITQEIRNRIPERKPSVYPVIITQVGSNTILDHMKIAEERSVKVVTIEGLRTLLKEIRQNKIPNKIAISLLSL
jgi:hypothetical protein